MYYLGRFDSYSDQVCSDMLLGNWKDVLRIIVMKIIICKLCYYVVFY